MKEEKALRETKRSKRIKEQIDRGFNIAAKWGQEREE